jgi:ribosome-associated toxin RatA of RatAB toxin-antitoxin module
MILFALAALLGAGGGWEKISDKEGVLIERRLRDGGLYEVRASAHASVTPQQFADMLWKHEDYPKFVPHLKSLKTLKTVGNERWNYEQVKLPVVSDRDYTVHLVREPPDTATGVIDIRFESANDQGPPPDKNHVRIEHIKGGWTIEPSEGGSDVTYDVFSDPGGGVPLWIINSAQKDATRDFVLAMVKRAKANAGQ